MSKVVRRRFGRTFKLEVVRRMDAGESGTALARELGIKRTILYRWRDAFRDGGEGFTLAMQTSPKDRMIVVGLIDMARRLGLEVVAEGIENSEDAAFLSAHGCDKGQGFLFGKPAPESIFTDTLWNGLRELRHA